MPCPNTNLHKYINNYHTALILFLLLQFSIIVHVFVFLFCLFSLHVHCFPTCSIVPFRLMTTRLNKYYYYHSRLLTRDIQRNQPDPLADQVRHRKIDATFRCLDLGFILGQPDQAV